MVGSIGALCTLAAVAPRLAARAPRVAPQRAAAAAALLQRPKRAQTARRCFFSSASAQSGLQKEITQEGSGASPKQGDKV